MARSSVDSPAPDGPMTTTSDPDRTRKLTRSSRVLRCPWSLMTKLSSSALSAVWAGSVATMRPPLMTSVVRPMPSRSPSRKTLPPGAGRPLIRTPLRPERSSMR